MILAAGLAALSLYPWNLGINVVHTWGMSSDSRRYSANGAYVVLDRREKDLIAIGYEELGIKFPEGEYVQRSTLARTSTWVSQKFRPGLIAGWLASNDLDGGQYLGLRVDGEAGRLIYTVSQNYGEWVWYDWAQYDTTRRPIRQSNLALHYVFQSFSFSAEYILTTLNKTSLQLGAIGCDWYPTGNFDLNLQFGRGRSRFQADWTALTLDNNPDDLTQYWKAKCFYRLIPQISLTGCWVKKFYAPTEANNPRGKYSAEFWVAGIQVRI